MQLGNPDQIAILTALSSYMRGLQADIQDLRNGRGAHESKHRTDTIAHLDRALGMYSRLFKRIGNATIIEGE